jgi:hypothetical protein
MEVISFSAVVQEKRDGGLRMALKLIVGVGTTLLTMGRFLLHHTVRTESNVVELSACWISTDLWTRQL